MKNTLSWVRSHNAYSLRCVRLCKSLDYSPAGSSVHGHSPGKNTGVGCHVLLQGIFPTQGSDLDLLHCRWSLYCLSHQGSPQKTLNTAISLVTMAVDFPAHVVSLGSLPPCSCALSSLRKTQVLQGSLRSRLLWMTHKQKWG